MDTYEIEFEPAEPDGFAAIVPAVPGLLVLGSSVDEVLEHARAAIAFRVGKPETPGCARRITVMPRGVSHYYVT